MYYAFGSYDARDSRLRYVLRDLLSRRSIARPIANHSFAIDFAKQRSLSIYAIRDEIISIARNRRQILRVTEESAPRQHVLFIYLC